MEAFILLIVLLTAVNTVLIIRLFHRRPDKPVVPSQPAGVSKKTREAAEVAAQKKLERAVERVSKAFERDLEAVRTKLNQRSEQLAKTTVDAELGNYTAALERLRKDAEARVTEIERSAERFRDERMKQVAAEIDAQRLRLATRLDEKLADVVSGYLAESLGEEVDLGAQTEYLLKNLEAHKADIRKDLTRSY